MDDTGLRSQNDGKRLAAERARMTDAQRIEHDQFCEKLKLADTYTDKEAANAGRVIRTEDRIRKESELSDILNRSERAAFQRLLLEETKRQQAQSADVLNDRSSSSGDAEHALKQPEPTTDYDPLRDFVTPDTKKNVEKEWEAAAREVTRGISL